MPNGENVKEKNIRAFCSLILSGFSSLVLEVIWVRLAVLVFGTTTQAATIVMATFMGGLALGNLSIERKIHLVHKPFRLYALAEMVTAVLAFAMGILYGKFGMSPTFPPVLLIVGLLVPTFCMGLTLPLAIEGLNRQEDSTPTVAWTYGVNTLGGAAGALAASFFLLPMAGLATTQIISSGILVVAAVNVWTLDSGFSEPIQKEGEQNGFDRKWSRWAALAAWAGGGALSLELVWTRLLSLILGPSVYALGVVLFVYLLAIASGAVLLPFLLRSFRLRHVIVVGFVFLAASIAWSILSFSFLPYIFVEGVRFFALKPSQLHFFEFFLSVIAIFPSALLQGMLLPSLILLSSDHRRESSSAAMMFGANTLGAILGIVVTGIYAVPHYGFLPILIFVLMGNVLIGVAWFGSSADLGGKSYRRFVAALLLLFATVFVWRAGEFWDRSVLASGVYKYAVGDALGGGSGKIELGEILYYREGISSTVAVTKTANDRVLSVDGKADASAMGDRSTQVLLAALPLSLSKEATRALVIGFASGVTAGVAALFPGVEVTAVEIEPAVYEASQYFLDVNHGPLRPPHRQVVADARHFLSRTQDTYDVITSEPSNPWMSGVAPLFTREFFEIAKSRLRNGGVMCQWLPIYGMTRALVASIIHTFHSVFPQIMIFESVEGYDLLLIGSNDPIYLSSRHLEERWNRDELRKELGDIGISRGIDLAGRFLMGNQGAREFGEAATINRDGNGYLEFQAPISLHLRTADENHTFLVSASEGILPYLVSEERTTDIQDALAERFFRRGDTRLMKLVSP